MLKSKDRAFVSLPSQNKLKSRLCEFKVDNCTESNYNNTHIWETGGRSEKKTTLNHHVYSDTPRGRLCMKIKDTVSDKTLACCFYSVVTIGIIFTNKLILGYGTNAFHFEYPSFLLFLQALAAICLIRVTAWWTSDTLPAFTKDRVLKWLPLNILFLIMITTSSFSLQLLSVAMVTIFKNMQTIAIAIGDKILFGRKLSYGTWLCVFIMLFGSLIAGYNDLEFNAVGYFWISVNCASGAAYVLYSKYAMESTKLKKFGSVYYNNILSIPLLITLLLVSNELPSVGNFQFSYIFIVVLILNLLFGFAISLAHFWVVDATSPTTATVLGAVNKVPLSIVSIWYFKTPFNTPGAISGAGALIGGVVYAVTQYLDEQDRKRKQVEDEKTPV